MLGLQKKMERRTRNNKEEGRVWDILCTMTQFILIKKTSEVSAAGPNEGVFQLLQYGY
jgi:hypothetical protein